MTLATCMRMVGYASMYLIALIAFLRLYEPARVLLLKLPKVGFILHAMAGGNVPPFFNRDVFKVEREWGRPGDVFIASGGKSGSTWVSNIVHEIRNRGQPAPFRDLFEEIRLPEFVYYPGQPLEERLDILRASRKGHPFAVYKTHQPPPELPVRDDARYIVVVRNFLAAAASGKTFLQSHGEAFARMWGGFPPQAGQEFNLNEEQFARYVLEDIGGGKGQLDIFMIDFFKAWWPYRRRPNVLFVHYSDLIRNHAGYIDRIAKFVGFSLSHEEVARIQEHTSFEYMKAHTSQFNIAHIHDEYKERGLVPRDVQFIAGDLIVKGPARLVETELSEGLIQAIRKKSIAALGGAIFEWVFNGGSVPLDSEPPM